MKTDDPRLSPNGCIMECCICLSAIEAGTSSATTSCGHSFHFGCLATWSKTKSTCPLCRQAFTETETPDWTEPEHVVPGRYDTLLGVFEWETRIREVMSSRLDPTRWTSDLRRQLQERYNLRPIEWVTFEGPDPVDIAFIVEKGHIDAESAKAYLAFYKDPVEVICQVAFELDHKPIPDFRPRDRGPSEPYVSRDISHRTGTTTLTLALHDDGYESA